MTKLPLKEFRGAKDLIADAVAAGVDATEKMHIAIARRPYAVLEQIAPIAAPVRAIEQVQNTVTAGVYRAIRTINRLTGVAAGGALDLVERSQNKRTPD